MDNLRKKYKPGWTIFIAECSDKSYYVDRCQNLRKRLWVLYNGGGYFGKSRKYKLPLKIVYIEEGLQFKEAYYKHAYMRKMNRKLREKLIFKNEWPIGGQYKKFLNGKN